MKIQHNSIITLGQKIYMALCFEWSNKFITIYKIIILDYEIFLSLPSST